MHYNLLEPLQGEETAPSDGAEAQVRDVGLAATAAGSDTYAAVSLATTGPVATAFPAATADAAGISPLPFSAQVVWQ